MSPSLGFILHKAAENMPERLEDHYHPTQMFQNNKKSGYHLIQPGGFSWLDFHAYEFAV